MSGLLPSSVGFVAWGRWHVQRRGALLAERVADVVAVTGVIVARRHSEPSGGRSASGSYVTLVEHRYEVRSFENPRAVSRSRYERPVVADAVLLTVLPTAFGLAQPTAVVRGESDHGGFIPLGDPRQGSVPRGGRPGTCRDLLRWSRGPLPPSN